MIVDTSAIVAILLGEPESAGFEAALVRARRCRMSTATYVEMVTVVDRKVGHDAVLEAEAMIAKANIDLVPVTVEQARWARHARLTYGVGRHSANLNLGDCFAYALAKETGEPLLFKGNDFAHTDVIAAA